jgi:hypothetical protein
VALLATAVALGAALAHALELPNKIGMSVDTYFIVQQVYSGWNRLGSARGRTHCNHRRPLAPSGRPRGLLASTGGTDLLCLRSDYFLGIHVPGQSGDHQLDRAAFELGGAAPAVGVLTSSQRDISNCGYGGPHRGRDQAAPLSLSAG